MEVLGILPPPSMELVTSSFPCLMTNSIILVRSILTPPSLQCEASYVTFNINNLRYADDTTFIAESKELKTIFTKVKEESEKVGLKLNI